MPLADANCLKLPGELGDEWQDDFVLLADAFTSGYHAVAKISVAPDDTVAIFGAGAVGLRPLVTTLVGVAVGRAGFSGIRSEAGGGMSLDARCAGAATDVGGNNDSIALRHVFDGSADFFDDA